MLGSIGSTRSASQPAPTPPHRVTHAPAAVMLRTTPDAAKFIARLIEAELKTFAPSTDPALTKLQAELFSLETEIESALA